MNKKINTKQPWIEQGNLLFSLSGPSVLKVEVLARDVGKSKSSFYHHFADMDLFIDCLLRHHMQQVHLIAAREAACRNVDPELLEVLVEFKLDMLFSRQLRIHRDVPAYRNCYEETNRHAVQSIIDIWADTMGLSEKSYLATMVLQLTMENFFLQITEETLNMQWLKAYAQELKVMVREFKKTE